MDIQFSNNGHSTLAASISSSDTSVTVASGHGSRFPSLTGSQYFYATLIDSSNNLEIVKVTARSSDVLTITRAQESTTARAYAIGDRIELRATAAGFNAIYTEAVADAIPGSDTIVNSMIATDAVNADSIAANAVGASELNVSGNGTSGQALLSDGDGTFSWGTGGSILQVVDTSHASTTTLSMNTGGASSWSELTTSIRLSITPKSSSSRLFFEFYAPFVSNNNNNLHYARFRDITNSQYVNLPSNNGSRQSVHWSMRIRSYDANDNSVLMMVAELDNSSTTARTYGIYMANEGAGLEFLNSSLSSASGTNSRMYFKITEVA